MKTHFESRWANHAARAVLTLAAVGLFFAMRPDSWPLSGDGAQFRVGVSEGRTYDEVLRQFVNPKEGGQKWFSAHLDLSAYAGREVRIIFNTDPGPKGGGDARNDLAVWGEPHIYSRR